MLSLPKLEDTYKVKHEPLAEGELMPVPSNFGDGWLTKSAQDLCKIAIAFGGFDAGEVVLAITKLQKRRGGRANLATVEKALQAVYEAHETPEDKQRRVAQVKAILEKIRG